MKVADLLYNVDITDELLNIIRDKCEHNFRFFASQPLNGPKLYRGMDVSDINVPIKRSGSIEYAIVPERVKPRKSQTSSNLFLSYISQSPTWQDIPARQYSTSCTTSLSTAEDFGDAYLIIPFDSVTEFAGCSTDFNLVPIGKDGNMLDFLSCISSLRVELNLASHPNPSFSMMMNSNVLQKTMDEMWSMEEIAQFSDMCEKARKFISGQPPGYRYAFDDLDRELNLLLDITGGKSLSDFFKSLTPKKMGVSTGNIQILKKLKSSEPEIWFRGPYLLIDINSMLDANDHRIPPEMLMRIIEKKL